MEHFVELGNLLADQVKVLVYSRIIMLHMKPTDLYHSTTIYWNTKPLLAVSGASES